MNHLATQTQTSNAMKQATSVMLTQPFEAARTAYATAVRFGWIQNSMLNSARFGRNLNLLEKLTLGPWARQV